MLDISAISKEFPELANLVPLKSVSGQKDVLKATFNSSPVVLKLVKDRAVYDKRTEREIEAVNKIGGSYIPSLVQAGTKKITGDTKFYIIEQFVDGKTYRECLDGKAVQDLSDVLCLADSLLNACRDFEAVDIVHRDLKPENLINR